ncbi:uncharacterized protein LOC110037186 [Phalaenopsis equestris]|uniref:uncharacterized protein LOC110037186 n=1 Tax=Phalaenopsis equestris TaxID=78828 RepID=UPI0009E2F8BC|nr:uncharacterized protein LOC110037186 [Phalaenopsis equestris]
MGKAFVKPSSRFTLISSRDLINQYGEEFLGLHWMINVEGLDAIPFHFQSNGLYLDRLAIFLSVFYLRWLWPIRIGSFGLVCSAWPASRSLCGEFASIMFFCFGP